MRDKQPHIITSTRGKKTPFPVDNFADLKEIRKLQWAEKCGRRILTLKKHAALKKKKTNYF